MDQGLSGDKVLYMGHSIFMSPEQIQKTIQGEEVTVDGACVPVIQAPDGSNTEPAGEMITNYYVKVGDKNKIVGNNRGFNLLIVKPEELLPPPKGIRWIQFNSINQLNNGKIIHQVVVQPEEVILESWMDRN